MNSTERVRATILGQPTDRQPIYGWVFADLSNEINARWGSVAAFEDKYEFDVAHLFGGPPCFDAELINSIAPLGTDELTPDLLVDQPILKDPDDLASYENLRESLAHHKARGRFCYVQTPGFFEHFNGIFGIENHLKFHIANFFVAPALCTNIEFGFIERCLHNSINIVFYICNRIFYCA